MNSTDSINRETLLKLVNLLKPAVATQDYIPALKHIKFGGGFASSYNDIAAIQIALPTKDLDLDLCLPGETLSKSLNSFNAEKVMLQAGADASLVIVSGRSKIKIPILPAKDFPLAIPEAKQKVPVLNITEDILAGIQRCLLSVGNDPTHPATMGVTLDAEAGKAVLFSTDNTTISRYATKSKVELPGDAPVILPAFFCEQLVSLSKAFPKVEVEVELHAGALVAYFFDEGDAEVAVLFQKTLVDLEPLDFPAIMSKHIKSKKVSDLIDPIPDAFDAAFTRALLILSNEVDKATKITCTSEAIKLLSTSSVGEASDSITFDAGDSPSEPFHIDPTLVTRACKVCTHLGFFNRVLVMGNKDASFLHLIAHCSV
jgi:DNA polymerase III sliding clamp (beta) subunit (PCNA family)